MSGMTAPFSRRWIRRWRDDLDYASPATHMLYVGAARDAKLTIATRTKMVTLRWLLRCPPRRARRNGVVSKTDRLSGACRRELKARLWSSRKREVVCGGATSDKSQPGLKKFNAPRN